MLYRTEVTYEQYDHCARSTQIFVELPTLNRKGSHGTPTIKVLFGSRKGVVSCVKQ